jgi:Uma2 family endonuclease
MQPTLPEPLRAMTLAQWSAMDEDEPGELVEDRLVEEEVPDAAHEVVVAWLIAALRSWVSAHGGIVLGSEAKFAVAARRGRKSDVSVFFAAGRIPPRRGIIRVPPDVAVEVISPARRDQLRDRVEKLSEYAAFGIRYYWMVDPELRSFEVLELGADGRYAHALGASSGTCIVPGCEGMSLDLDAMFSETDKLGPDSSEEE